MSMTEALPPTPAVTATPARRPPVSIVKRVLQPRPVQLVLVTIAVIAISTALHSDFAALGNISFMISDAMAVAIIAVGQTMVLLTRGIDLSVAPVMGTVALVVGFLAQNHGLTPLEGLPIALLIGVVAGAGNGLLVAFIGIPPIIATLGTLSVYGGVEAIVANGKEVVTLPAAYFNLGNNNVINGIPWDALVGLAVTAVVALALWRTIFGRSIFAVGANVDAARRAGLSVRRVIFSSYVLCGLLAGLGGLIFLAHTGSADSTTGADTNIELTSVAAALVGGSALTGAKGNVFGSFLGAIFLSVALTALVFLKINAEWEPAGVGALVLIAVMTDGSAGGRPSLRALRSMVLHRQTGSPSGGER